MLRTRDKFYKEQGAKSVVCIQIPGKRERNHFCGVERWILHLVYIFQVEAIVRIVGEGEIHIKKERTRVLRRVCVALYISIEESFTGIHVEKGVVLKRSENVAIWGGRYVHEESIYTEKALRTNKKTYGGGLMCRVKRYIPRRI